MFYSIIIIIIRREQLTCIVSCERASCCEPRKRKGKIFVGPTLDTGRQGCDIDVNGGHLYPLAVDVLYAVWLWQRLGWVAWNSRKPPTTHVAVDNVRAFVQGLDSL